MRPIRSGIPLLLAVICVLSVGPALARQVTLTLQDGRTISGDLTAQTDQEITLSIAGIKTVLPREQVKDVQFTPSIEEQYAAKRAQIADTDIEGRFALAQWLVDKNALELAIRELTQLSTAAPDNVRVSLLRRTAEEALKLRQPSTTRPIVPRNPAPAVGQAGSGIPGQPLSEAQITALKIELAGPGLKRATVPNDVLDELFKRYADNLLVPSDRRIQDALKADSNVYRKIDLLRMVGAKDLYARVQVKDDPPVVAAFRKFHDSYVVNYCGTSECHGGTHGGTFSLFRAEPGSEVTVYSNFAILLLYQDKAGKMVDYTAGSPQEMAQSQLLQYGLPRNAAKLKHPDVPGLRGFIPTERDPKYAMVFDFISDPRLHGMTVFPITYKLPVYGRSTTAPATTRPAGR